MASDLGDFLRHMSSSGLLSASLPMRWLTLLRHDRLSYFTIVV